MTNYAAGNGCIMIHGKRTCSTLAPFTVILHSCAKCTYMCFLRGYLLFISDMLFE